MQCVCHTGLEPRTSRQGPRQACYSHVCASPRTGRGGICAWLGEWYDNNNNNEPALLLRFLTGRSALHAIRHFSSVSRRRFGQSGCPFEATEGFETALSRHVSK